MKVLAVAVATSPWLAMTVTVEVAMTVHVPLMKTKGAMAAEMKAVMIELHKIWGRFKFFLSSVSGPMAQQETVPKKTVVDQGPYSGIVH